MKRVYTVGQVNRYVKGMFSQDILLSSISVQGEVSNCKYHTSGHVYFSLKDETGSLSAIMFAGSRRTGLTFPMKDGDRVVCDGSVDVYERDGRYQLYARSIRPLGAGLLYEKYMALKKELSEMGLFDQAYKKPIPKFATRIGVVTAPTGAAIRDIQTISSRRNPYVQLYLFPALVQGEGAKTSIARGIRALDDFGVDVIIVGRGGGSLEDLWAFNEEEVAYAIFECRTPVISAVGHQTDTTISDLVADLRAPTPSAAAELAVFDYRAFADTLEGYAGKLENNVLRRLNAAKGEARYYAVRFAAMSPQARLNDRRRTAAEEEIALTRLMEMKIEAARRRSEDLAGRLTADEEGLIRARRQELALMAERFRGLSPLTRLSQGFSFVSDLEGHTVSRTGDARVGDLLRIRVRDGSFITEVKEVKDNG